MSSLNLKDALASAPAERRAFVWSFLYFFCLIAGYYVLRALREEMGVRFGVGRIQWLFTATFVSMLVLVPVYGALVSRFARRRLVPIVYSFFAVCLIAFHLLLETPTWGALLAPVFFVWLSVYNLFVVSMFWSFMADVWLADQAKRFYAPIAAAGSIGGIVGPFLTQLLVDDIGIANLFLISAGLLIVCLISVQQLLPQLRASVALRGERNADEAIGGSWWAGARLVVSRRLLLGIAGVMMLGVLVGTLLYVQQLKMVDSMGWTSEQRVAFFSRLDLAVNLLALLVQVFIARWVSVRYGTAIALLVPATLMILGMLSLAFLPIWAVLTTVQVASRAGRFSMLEPGIASLYTMVDSETRYKAKSFIDTVVYRGSDAGSAWLSRALTDLGAALSNIAWIGVAAAASLALLVRYLGRRHEAAIRDSRTSL